MSPSSEISGFYKLTQEERLEILREFGLGNEEIEAITNTGSLSFEQANRMIENVVGTMELPLGVAVNFLINGRDYLVPMAIEEPSVVAAASNAAKIARAGGGFEASSTDPVMIGQVQLIDIPDTGNAQKSILENLDALTDIANEQDPMLVKFGGGARGLQVRVIDTPWGDMIVCHLLVDCRDAMGANAVNTMVEAIAPHLEELSGGRALLRIISNLATERLARASAVFPADELGGQEVVESIMSAYRLACVDPYRCATHNKGAMNGIIAAANAVGQDTRALESGAHAYAAITGKYLPLTSYEVNENGDLVGSIELPMAIGLVGGAIASHPVAKASRKLLGVKTAAELGQVFAAVGLAQNLAALRALATEGIQRGHMRLHARNVAAQAGADENEVDKIAELMIKEGKVRADRAKELLETLRS
jgi:hydroxymethylglutaryl-CoA reductase